jgi:hypothetical protein
MLPRTCARALTHSRGSTAGFNLGGSSHPPCAGALAREPRTGVYEARVDLRAAAAVGTGRNTREKEVLSTSETPGLM